MKISESLTCCWAFIRRSALASLVFGVIVSSSTIACNPPPEDIKAKSGMDDLLRRVISSPPVLVSPTEVAETLGIGGRATDVQRDELIQRLEGAVVEWRVQVYNIELVDGMYRLTSLPLGTSDEKAISVFASATVIPKTERDHAILRKVKTGDSVRIKGLVQTISLRTLVVIGPATLAD